MTAIPRKSRVAAAFGAAAEGYEAAAGLQREVAEGLAARIAAFGVPPGPRILEIGCGTGFLSRALAGHCPGADWVVTDLSAAMVTACRSALPVPARFLVMDGERPAVAPGFDLVCASLALQWFERPAEAMAAWSGLLRPGGVLAWSTLVQGTLEEWRQAHAELGLVSGVPVFPPQSRWESCWPAGGQGQVEAVRIERSHVGAYAFLTALRGIGAQVPVEGYHPMPPGALRRVMRRFAPPVGLRVSYRVAYGLWRAGTVS